MTEIHPLFQVTYGSHLYGTATPTSDIDLKVVYLPLLSNVLLGKKHAIFKQRYDAEGNKIPDDGTPMPDNGKEVEYFPLATFARDFIAGQTYAVEIAYAYLKDLEDVGYSNEQDERVKNFIRVLTNEFGTKEVYSMVGFAIKQTMDYVQRGERLNAAEKVRDVILETVEEAKHIAAHIRLDDEINGRRVLDVVAEKTGLKIGLNTGGNKPIRSLELNGRSYLETSALSHVLTAVEKLIACYGERSTKAAKTDVDFKSLSHAVRVYQQSIELLETGKLTFPRANATQLLEIKEGRANLEDVKALLKSLDTEVQEKILTSTVRPKTPELEAKLEKFLLDTLYQLYDIKPTSSA